MTSLSPLSDPSDAPLPDWAYGVRRLVVFSGAGLSTDSGIQDFRGPSGVWTLSPGQQTKHTYQAFMTDPDLRVSYWKTRYEHTVWEAEPNAGHRAVATLADSDIDTTVVTQNTDGLHQLAGTPADRVVELHGTMRTTLCVACGYRGPTTDVLTRIAAGEATPSCPECGGIQKTASTMFGQTMSPEVFSRAQEAVTSCDLILATGTTLTVEPAGSLCAAAVHAGATLVIVNWDPTPYDAIATDLIRDPLGEALPRIVAQLRAAAAASAAGSPGPEAARGRSGGTQEPLVLREMDRLRGSAEAYGLLLAPQVLESAVATAALCGAADEEAALGALGHIQALEDPALRLRTAQWLRTEFPPAPESAESSPAPESSPSYWNEALPDTPTEDLLAVLVTPRFLMSTMMETTEEQDRRALTVLARAAETRPGVRARLAELVSLLPGVSPMAIEVALSSGYAAPLAEALTALAEKHPALPADLLDAVPAGVTVFGEFPVLLAESLVDAYELRAKTQNGLRGLTKTLVGLSGRLADLGRGEQALAAARRAVENAARLEDGQEWQAHAAQALDRATQLTT
ncbi:Sir2 family NAD-dependent protein deacetylase [Streptomyces sp. NBC_00536]|uniref:SIR2 family NAD-dependent protein deacylase n=1 Tax=Streptomyces sp. NBC_00536 TaxID=2975769 RepID=UPI002E80FAF1|nr:Sir2 family NAD-dependent protein deacetylase [Streptomyces sp. NBC_00536]WUC79615.1 Sir2 family NAD-dependent protein deacetylase [Streptomyces sp. NBC_00536]